MAHWGAGKKRPRPERIPAGRRNLKTAAWPPAPLAPSSLDPLELIKRSLAEKDSVMLGRQVSYRLSTVESLPPLWAEANEVLETLESMLSHLAGRAIRKSAISISLREFSLRSGRAVEFAFETTDRFFKEGEDREFITRLFDGSDDQESGVSLARLRERVMNQHGRLWADPPLYNRIKYHIVFPSSEEVVNLQMSGQEAYRYEICMINYASIRKSFGIKKSSGLIEQIERYVKSLVRHPIDMVTSDPERGSLTVVYEAQHGAAESVSSRISKRLGRETFHIGKKTVDLDFKYDLTTLSRPVESGGVRAKTRG